MRGGLPPSSALLPYMGAPPHAPGDFLPDEKVTKESPRGGHPSGYSPEGDASLPLQHIVLLPPRRAFSHKKRPICHFEFVGKSVFILPFSSFEGTLSTFNPWHGRIDFEDA